MDITSMYIAKVVTMIITVFMTSVNVGLMAKTSVPVQNHVYLTVGICGFVISMGWL